MKTYLALLNCLRPYRRLLVQTLAATVAFSILSALSIGMISPLTRALFARVERATVVGVAESPAPRPGDPAARSVAPVPPAPPGSAPSVPQVEDLPMVRDLRARAEAYLFAGDPADALRRVCIAILLVFFLKGLANYAEQISINQIEQSVVRDLRNRIFAHLTTLSLDFFHRRRAGHLISRVTNDVGLVRGALTAGIFISTREILLLITSLFWVFWVSVPLALISLLVVPPSALMIVALSRKLRRGSERTQERMADLTTVLHETLGGMRVVKAFAMEGFELARFRAATERAYRAFVRLRRYWAVSSPLSEMLGVAAAVAVIAYGGQLILVKQTLTPDRFLLFLVAMLSMNRPLRKIASVNTDIQEGVAAAERIFGLLQVAPSVVERPGARPVDRLTTAIRFEGVEFGYEPDRPVLTGINLEVRAGEVVALVGPSGAGKSTLADLVPRFYDPTRGRITLDGVDLKDLRLAHLRRLIGIVTQDVILFNDTVRANIAYGDDSMPEEKVREAARAAHAAEFIEALPQGYATEIGDRGVRLSGGQRQRLAIARAILKNPPILILDEATSALDSESERLVQAAIARLMAGRTALVIAHRLSTVRAADRIVVVDRGRIIEEGSHSELMRRGGLYTRLHAMDTAGSGAEGGTAADAADTFKEAAW
jgi:subfamily B ATP-binding cassette protein MsbA